MMIAFSFWLTSLCMRSSRFIHLNRTDSNSFLFIAGWYSIVYMYYFFTIHSSADGNLVVFFCLFGFCCFCFSVQFSCSVQFSSVAQSSLTLWDPMNHSTPGLPVHHQLPEFTQTHIHQVSDAFQPSHPPSSPSPPAPNPSQHQSLFQWVSSSQEVAKLLEFQL